MSPAWIGIPYEVNGTPPHGADCYTLALAYAREAFGQIWPRYFYDATNLRGDSSRIMLREMVAHGDWLRVIEPEPGDLVALRIQGVACHCGVYLGGGDLLHTLKGRASCIERLDVWQQAVAGFFRWQGARCPTR